MTTNPMQVTQLIERWQGGDESALSELTPFVYEELKRLAASYMRKESPGHTLQATALLNEAFLKLAGAEVDFANRSHFLATAARMMRRTLVDHARAKNSHKRGSGQRKITLDDDLAIDRHASEDLLDIDMALTKLEAQDPRLATAIELVFFGGLTYEQAADQLGVSRSAFYQDLSFAKAWLRKEIE